MSERSRELGVVRIGSARGKVALYLDEDQATDLAYSYAHDDLAHRELLDAVAKAYPKDDAEAAAGAGEQP